MKNKHLKREKHKGQVKPHQRESHILNNIKKQYLSRFVYLDMEKADIIDYPHMQDTPISYVPPYVSKVIVIGGQDRFMIKNSRSVAVVNRSACILYEDQETAQLLWEFQNEQV